MVNVNRELSVFEQYRLKVEKLLEYDNALTRIILAGEEKTGFNRVTLVTGKIFST